MWKLTEIVERPSTAIKIIVGVLGCIVFGSFAFGTEKYSIASQAELVVVGKIENVTAYPWFGGWRFAGDIVPREVLFGRTDLGASIPYEFVCSCCPFWPKPEFVKLTVTTGIWFLNKSKGHWETAGNCSDPGYRSIVDLKAFRAYLSRRQ